MQWSTIRIEKKSFIEFSNWCNINFTCLITILIVFTPENHYVFIFVLIVLRIISRGVEIAIAFYNDVVKVNSKSFVDTKHNTIKYINGYQSSLIRQNGRLSLAIHSLIELFLLFGISYFLLFYFLDFGSKIQNPTLLGSILFSTNLGLFNFSFGNYTIIYLSLLHTSQVVLSGILILLSIAQYIGADRELNHNDSIFYYKAAVILNDKREKNLEYGKPVFDEPFNDLLKQDTDNQDNIQNLDKLLVGIKPSTIEAE
ncbi:hypothetical protein [Neobacillus niacini]|uniref:hypothetical protein n=1 Tax=Neobacillus niacini TaxID=86668 RepID=UPI0005EDD770|nr:hypothetical protein [Neobacillus niacini]